MAKSSFATVGKKTGDIDVRLSYRIIELFSKGLYASSHKAIEELVANSFDAGAQNVHVLLSPNLHDQDATIVVVDDGEGMGADGLRKHWLIGISDKRRLARLPSGRQQIGKFGIGKLATYVLASRLTHVAKHDGRYYSTSMDFDALDSRTDKEVEPKTPIRIPLRELTESEAKKALKPWLDTPALKATRMVLFGSRAPASWTFAIMSSLKEKVHEIKPGMLEWVLRTALPMRPDFSVWLNGKKLDSTKREKGLLKTWVIGKDIVQLPKPAPKDASPREDANADPSSEHRYGLDVPGLGRITGYAEAYKDLLTGKSDEIGRSYGFFIYVYGRLINVVDGHFGISPDELRHGTFGRFRLVININALDEELRSNREAISEGPLLSTAQDVLRSVFNVVRPTIERHDEEEEPGAKLARRLAASPASLARWPIIDLARAVLEGKGRSRYLIVPDRLSAQGRADFLASLEQRLTEADRFVTGLTTNYSGKPDGGLAQYDTVSGTLHVNAWHPFVATFYDEFVSRGAGHPLELFAMAEVLLEAHLHSLDIKQAQIDDFLSLRDRLLRYLANESARQSAFAVALALQEARNSPDALEERLCDAFKSLGFEAITIGGKGKPDGVATALLSADKTGTARQYSVTLEAKSKEKDAGKVSAATVNVSAICRHRNDYSCQHAVVVGRAFPTATADSALAKELDDDYRKTVAVGEPKTITLITIDDLAKLVRLRPVKQVGLVKLRELFNRCRLPEESTAWIESVRIGKVKKPPYRQIISTIETLQKEFTREPVKYAALRVELSHLKPAVRYENDEELMDICKAMAQMAPGAVFATSQTVEFDQSAKNVLEAIESAMRDYPDDSLP